MTVLWSKWIQYFHNLIQCPVSLGTPSLLVRPMCCACGGPLVNNKRRLCLFEVAFFYCRTLAMRSLHRSVNTAVNNGQKENRDTQKSTTAWLPGVFFFFWFSNAVPCLSSLKWMPLPLHAAPVKLQLRAAGACLSHRSSICVAYTWCKWVCPFWGMS